MGSGTFLWPCAIVCPAHRSSCMTRRAMCGTFNAYTHPCLAVLLALRRPHSARELFGHNAAGTGAPRLLSWSHMHRTLDAESREKEMTLGHSGQSAPCLSCLCGPPRPPRAVRACGRPLCLVPQCVRPRRTINKTRYAGPPLSYQLTAPASSAPEAALVGGVGPQ